MEPVRSGDWTCPGCQEVSDRHLCVFGLISGFLIAPHHPGELGAAAGVPAVRAGGARSPAAAGAAGGEAWGLGVRPVQAGHSSHPPPSAPAPR